MLTLNQSNKQKDNEINLSILSAIKSVETQRSSFVKSSSKFNLTLDYKTNKSNDNSPTSQTKMSKISTKLSSTQLDRISEHSCREIVSYQKLLVI
jgi:hypothetical protein